jgi:hypothetical protein
MSDGALVMDDHNQLGMKVIIAGTNQSSAQPECLV